MTKKKTNSAPAKSFSKKRTLNNPGGGHHTEGAPFQDQDAKRRLGNFTGQGEHARQGARNAGMVGQPKQSFTSEGKRAE